jgi:hypothetical protein
MTIPGYDDWKLATPPEYDAPCCKKCGTELEWANCWQVGCEDGTYDLYEDDPIYYSPGQRASCEECDGKGGWLYCPTCERSADPTSGPNNADPT